MMLDAILWPVDLACSVVTLIANFFLWFTFSLLPQLAGLSYNLTVIAMPVAFNAVVSVCELLFGFCLSAAEVAWDFMLMLWMGCSACVEFLSEVIPILGQWLIEALSWLVSGSILVSELLLNLTWSAVTLVGGVVGMGCQLLCMFLGMVLNWVGDVVHLTAGAGNMALNYCMDLPWMEWVVTSVSCVGTFLKSLSRWMDDLVGYLNSVSSSTGREASEVSSEIHQTPLDLEDKEPYSKFTTDEFETKSLPSVWEQFSAVVPSWQQLIGLAVVGGLLVAAALTIRRLLVATRERQREPEHPVEVRTRSLPAAPGTVHPPPSSSPQRSPGDRQRRRRVRSPSSRLGGSSPSVGEDLARTGLDQSLRQLSEDLEREREQNLCVVCWDRKRNILLRPCNHYCVCSGCLRGLRQTCPICRKRVASSEEVFHA